MPLEMPASDLSRAKSSEPQTDWPDELGVFARWGKKRVETVIPREQFFGTGSYGAPITGDWLVSAIERLRKAKPK